MRGELKEAAQIPQVLEPGARVAWDGTGIRRVLTEVRDGYWRGVSADGHEVEICRADVVQARLRVIAPAPRSGQAWASSGGAPVPLKAAADKTWDAVVIARVFLENGFTYAGEVSPALAAPPRVASLEPLAPPRSQDEPAPLSIADARRLILDVIADAAPRRPTAFTSALCSLAESDAPMLCTILATSAALTALEEDLPEPGAPAAWETRRARSRADDVFRVAAQVDYVPASVEAAFDIYLARRPHAARPRS